MILWAIPFLALAAVTARDPSQFEGAAWLVLLPVGAAILGIWLVYTALRTSDEVFERRIDVLADGGDWIGLIFVVVVIVAAVPIYEIYRLVRPKSE